MARAALSGRLTWQLAEVVDVLTEAPRVKTIAFDVANWAGHRAGQHVDVRLTAEDGYQAEHLAHKSLWAITASHYAARNDGISAPDGQEMAFMVSADDRRAAYDRVRAELAVHGYKPDEWAIGSTSTPLILEA